MNFWISPLKGWQAALWAVVWLLVAAVTTWIFWPIFQPRYVFFLAAVAIIAARSGRVYGIGSSVLAMTLVTLLLSKGRSDIAFQAGAVFVTSLVIIILADIASGNATAARKGEAALRLSKEETQKSLVAEQITRGELERANRAKDEFLATLSHELRTPLMAIMGWGQMLKAGKVSPEDMKQAAEVIERNSRLQVQLIEDLLDMNRIVNGKLTLETKDVDLIDVVDAACNTVVHAATAKGIHLFKTFDRNVGIVHGDSYRLQQCVGNLLNNAIKFTPQEGNVDVIVERFGNQALIKVKDAGIGIKPDFLPRIFDRFTQVDTSSSRKYSGLGLGLAIVKSLVEMHQGSVSVESEGEGKGAQFTISLPLADAKKHEPRGFSYALTFGSLPTPLAGVKILIVDDDPDARKVVEHALRHAGAEPSIAQSGREALELIRETQFEVLISDIAMPEMDGHQLLRHMRDSSFVSNNLHTIALTAYARQEDRKRAFDAGFEQVLAKPVDMDELVGSIAHIMGAHHHEII